MVHFSSEHLSLRFCTADQLNENMKMSFFTLAMSWWPTWFCFWSCYLHLSAGLEQPLWISVKQNLLLMTIIFTLWFPLASTHVPSPPSSSPTLAFSLWLLAIASWVPSFLKSWRRSEYAIISPFSLIFTFMSPAFNYACIFVWQHNEIMTKRAMKDKRLAMTDTLWDITRSPYSNNVKTEMWVLFYLVANSKQAWGHHHWSPGSRNSEKIKFTKYVCPKIPPISNQSF